MAALINVLQFGAPDSFVPRKSAVNIRLGLYSDVATLWRAPSACRYWLP